MLQKKPLKRIAVSPNVRQGIRMNITRIFRSDSAYPLQICKYLGGCAPGNIAVRGNLNLLQSKTIAIFCSMKCPGSLILQTYEFAEYLRESHTTVVSGFHSPMEQECLGIFLRGSQPVIWCPARSIETMRIRKEMKKPLEEGRILILSGFAEKKRRIGRDNSLERNRFVAALADRIFIAYAHPNGNTEKLCREVLAWGKPVDTFASKDNENLIALGVSPTSSL